MKIYIATHSDKCAEREMGNPCVCQSSNFCV